MYLPNSRNIHPSDSLFYSFLILYMSKIEHPERYACFLHLAMSKGDIFHHIRERKHHRIIISYEVIDFHRSIRRSYGKSFYDFSRTTKRKPKMRGKFHDFRKSDHRICYERIIDEFHCLSWSYRTHILEIRSHHREMWPNFFEHFLVSPDKNREFSGDGFRGTPCDRSIEKMYSFLW